MKKLTLIIVSTISCASLILGTYIGSLIGIDVENKKFKQYLLDEGYAEYNKKTAEWQLLEASEIQGNLIPQKEKQNFVNIDDQIRFLEDELILLRKQKASVKNKISNQKLDPKVLVSLK